MRRFFAATLFLIAMTLFGCGNDEPAQIDKLVIGIDDEFAPIAFHNERNELVGFDIDLAKEAAKRLGVAVEFKPIDWHKKREELMSGNINVIWNGLDITEERKEYMIFTEPYMDDRQIILVNKNSEKTIFTLGDLTGKIVGVQSGSTSEDYFNRDEILKRSFADFKSYDSFSNLVEALNSGAVDVLVCDELVARYEMHIHPDRFELVDIKIGDITEMAIGFRKEDEELRDRVQKVFDDMIADGTAKKISEQWFNADVIKQQ